MWMIIILGLCLVILFAATIARIFFSVCDTIEVYNIRQENPLDYQRPHHNAELLSMRSSKQTVAQSRALFR